MAAKLRQRSYAEIRAALLARQEIALLDVREEDPHAQAHPLFAANFPLSQLELNAYDKLPRRDVDIVVLDAGEGDAKRAAEKLSALGYSAVSILAGGVAGWAAAGGELFRDVNVPSKAFGELVESVRHTPSLTAEEVQSLIETKADIIIVDARRFDEYQTMSIPTSTSVPGAELVLRLPQLAPNPQTRVIVNCAGRTRSIIGTQSLINAGLPNPVSALRNGTIGWTLAGQSLAHNQNRRYGPVDRDRHAQSARAARQVAERAGVRRTHLEEIAAWHRQEERTTYFFDVRSQEEFIDGHLPNFRQVAGGQLVQETEMVAPVRGARIVLVDDDGVRANMSASWLAQMGWEVFVLDDVRPGDFSQQGPWQSTRPPAPAVDTLTPAELQVRLARSERIAVLDLASSSEYRKSHIPGAWFIQRNQLNESLAQIPSPACHVLTCRTDALARFTAPELRALVSGELLVLEGGNDAWKAAGLPLENGNSRLASQPNDRYRRPYEGTDNPREAMQGYLDWEFGLVEQLSRDGTHGFFVI